MQRTLQELLVACVKEGMSGQSGINPCSYPSQILCLAEQVLFTERCEQALHTDTLTEFAIELDAQLDSYTNSDMQVHTLLIVVCGYELSYYSLVVMKLLSECWS